MNATLSNPPTAPHFVKAKVLASRYNVTVQCILNWAKQGKLPCVRFQETVRFDLATVAGIIEGTSNRKELAK